MRVRAMVMVLSCCGALFAGCEVRTEIDAGGRDSAVPATDAGDTDAGPARDGGIRLDNVLIYAHSGDTLYEFSPYTNTVTELGEFSVDDGVPPNMLDLAVDADGRIFTVGYERIYVVDPETMETTTAMTYRMDRDPTIDPLFALSFISADQSPTGREILVGATNSGSLFEVDLVTDRLVPRGHYPDNWGSSGDITSIQGLGTFATLRQRDAMGRPIDGEPDAVAEIQIPMSGDATVRIIGTIRTAGGQTFTALFGLGYWGRDLYGFTNGGALLRIDRDTGVSELVSDTTGAGQFYGAGVTTKVPFLI
ncbi:MAG: hypothetical protein AB7S26_33305 [Sandaracinaceae bacterium]